MGQGEKTNLLMIETQNNSNKPLNKVEETETTAQKWKRFFRVFYKTFLVVSVLVFIVNIECSKDYSNYDKTVETVFGSEVKLLYHGRIYIDSRLERTEFENPFFILPSKNLNIAISFYLYRADIWAVFPLSIILTFIFKDIKRLPKRDKLYTLFKVRLEE